MEEIKVDSKKKSRITTSKLTPKQELFVREYLKDLNAKQACIRVGYPINSAKVRGSQMLSNTNVADAISEQFKKRTEKVEISVEWVLTQIKAIAECDPQDAYNEDGSLKPLSEIPVAVRKTISSIEVDEIWEMQQDEDNPRRRHKVQIGETKKVRFWSKDHSLELLGKYLAMFVERQRHEDPSGNALPAVQVHIHKSLGAPVADAVTRAEVKANV